MRRTLLMAASLLVMAGAAQAEPQLKLNDKGYFETPGLNVTVFADIYPDGHQTGVTVIQHGTRVAANGDLRLEPGIIGQLVDAFLADHRRIHVGDEYVRHTERFGGDDRVGRCEALVDYPPQQGDIVAG